MVKARDRPDITIFSSDKDFCQLLQHGVEILKPTRGGRNYTLVTDELFQHEFGLSPLQFVDMAALMGDPVRLPESTMHAPARTVGRLGRPKGLVSLATQVDDVPGVKGVGPKTAALLIRKHGTIHELFAAIDSGAGKEALGVGARLRLNLLADRTKALLARQLICLRTDLDVSRHLSNHSAKATLDAMLRMRSPDWAELRSAVQELETPALLLPLQSCGLCNGDHLLA
jgi:DNA polymerase-1